MKKLLIVSALILGLATTQIAFASGLFSNTSAALKNTGNAVKADINTQTKAAKEKEAKYTAEQKAKLEAQQKALKEKEAKYKAEQKAKADAQKKKAEKEKAKRDAANKKLKSDWNTTKDDIKNIFSK